MLTRLAGSVATQSLLGAAAVSVGQRRLARGPKLPGWTSALEIAVQFLHDRVAVATSLQPVKEGRAFLDSLAGMMAGFSLVTWWPNANGVSGEWFAPYSARRDSLCLYLHGGGYCFYPHFQRDLIARVAYALQAKTFAPDYRLAPEDPFPAQLEDACAAYDWLCEQGSPSRIVLAGDSSGGNLVLSLLLRLRDSGRPLPRLAVCLSPGTDLTQYQQIADTDETCDWIDCRLFNQWSAWYTNGNAVDEPLVSPVHASLRGLPPVYIQAGGAELLYPRIQAFAARAHEQGANVVLEIWRHMPHVFQSFAGLQGEADDALARLGCIADVHMAPGGSARAVARTR